MPLPVAHALAAMIVASGSVGGTIPVDTTLERDNIVVAQVLRYPGRLAIEQPETAEGTTPLHLTSTPCEVTQGHDHVPMTNSGRFAIYPYEEGENPFWYCLVERKIFNDLLGGRPPHHGQGEPDDAS